MELGGGKKRKEEGSEVKDHLTYPPPSQLHQLHLPYELTYCRTRPTSYPYSVRLRASLIRLDSALYSFTS